MAALTSLLTPVKIDGDPSGKTCKQGEEQMAGGGGVEGGVGLQQSKQQINGDPCACRCTPPAPHGCTATSVRTCTDVMPSPTNDTHSYSDGNPEANYWSDLNLKGL